MARTTRVFLAIAIIELFLAGLWFWLARMVIAHPENAAPEAQVVIGQTIGAAMGVIAGLAIPLWVLARRNDRKTA